MNISDRSANIGVAIIVIVVWTVCIGAAYEAYQMVKNNECSEWQTKPLDQVGKCLKTYIKE